MQRNANTAALRQTGISGPLDAQRERERERERESLRAVFWRFQI
jgi:hypothetical protein